MFSKIIKTLLVFLLFLAGLFFHGNTVHAASSGDSVDFLSDSFYETESLAAEVGDPLESMNRVVFKVNDTLYIWVMDPIASFYSKIVPSDIRTSFYCFFRNLEEPVRFINTLLQGRIHDAGTVLLRFVVNSTLGIYGFGDVATRVFDIPQVEASLGETFATWGIGDGFYLVIPLYGSTTVRDFTGTIIDGFSVTPYYTWTDDIYVQGGVYVGRLEASRA